jgi:hypothetical protein
MAIYARETASAEYEDVLLIDKAGRTPVIIHHLEQAASLYPWKKFCNFSVPLSETHNHQPGLVKKITRQLRSKPVFRSVYNLLLKRYKKKTIRTHQHMLQKQLGKYTGEVQLFVVKETILSDALSGLYPNAPVNYFEHGLSDYTLLSDGAERDGKFFCIFAGQFRTYLANAGKDFEFVRPFLKDDAFAATCQNYFAFEKENAIALRSVFSPGMRYALLLMQPVEIMDVNDKNFWTGFLEKCIAVSGAAADLCFIVKPHPYQSTDSIRVVNDFFSDRKINFIIPPATITSTSIEISFSQWEKHISFVFSPYSSSVYYLSKLYPSKDRRYFHDYEYMKKHLAHSPEYFRTLFLKTDPLIREVFSENCIAL